MFAQVTDSLDFARAVQAGRVLEGELSLVALPRLAAALHEPAGSAKYRLSFERGQLGMASVRVEVGAQLPLQCQRSLEPFLLPVLIDTRLSPVRDDADAAALPEGWEPVELDGEGRLIPSDLIEDELLLALPAVPRSPDADEAPLLWEERDPADQGPFAALKGLRS